MTFADRDYQTIVEALDIAAGRYLTDAHLCDNANQPRTAEHFRELSKRAGALSEKIREAVGL